MYNRILVPLDGSELAEHVLPYVGILARALLSQVHLVRVVEPPINELALATRRQYYQGIMEAESNRAEDYLEKMAASLREDDRSVSFAVVQGSPASCIATEAERESGTIVAMSSHGRAGLTRWLLGSVATQVLQTTSNPLLIVRASERGQSAGEINIGQALVPPDGSELAEKILPIVGRLARALKLRVTLVQVTPPRESYYLYADYPPPDWDNLITEVDGKAAEYLHQTGQKLLRQGTPSVEERLLHGSPAKAIIELAREIPDSMVMMTTHGQSGVGRWVLGSVADRVVRHSGDPVLLLRVPSEGKD